MKTIGITGGIGAGKSLILNYIGSHYKAKIYMADNIANAMKEPGQSCYESIVDLLGHQVLDEDGRINKGKMAELIFADRELLKQVNEVIHPAVKKFVLTEIEKEKQKKEYDFFILEAALLIEEGYDEILDELWYIRAEEEVRSNRLRQSRNYSDEKIRDIMKSQFSDEIFRKHCKVIIDNNHDPEETYKQIDEKLGEYIGAEGK
ncbi:MAG: dephospho-CoA kinase [Lachnospiraceae bacterium]|nr:dephospho-CoA kinase [Lachnospiraceae bacterium]